MRDDTERDREEARAEAETVEADEELEELEELVAEDGTPPPDWQALAEDREQQLLRLRADFENFRRRTERERETLQGMVAADILGRLLSVHDNLDRALKSLPDTEEAEAWRTGIAMTQRSFLEVLRSQGVEAISTVGQPFDPAVHEAILRSPAADPEGTVIEELQAGFRWKDRVLRAALVRVSAGPESDPAPTGDET